MVNCDEIMGYRLRERMGGWGRETTKTWPSELRKCSYLHSTFLFRRLAGVSPGREAKPRENMESTLRIPLVPGWSTVLGDEGLCVFLSLKHFEVNEQAYLWSTLKTKKERKKKKKQYKTKKEESFVGASSSSTHHHFSKLLLEIHQAPSIS